MWDFIYFFVSFIQWIIMVFLTPVIGCSIYGGILVQYIWEVVWQYYLGVGKLLIPSSYKFFGYLLIFLYLFSAYLWDSVVLTKNFNLKHIPGSRVPGSLDCIILLITKKKYIFWYYYFIYYII